MKPYLAGLLSFFVLDFLWLGVVAKMFYREQLAPIARLAGDGSLAPIWAVAIPVYFILALGEYLFVLPRTIDGPWTTALAYGAAFGFVVFATYDLTNWSTLKDFGPKLALVDICWGMFSCGTAAIFMRIVGR